MNELSLFTGAGGGLLGTKLLGWKTIGYVEKELYCQKVIRQRIADGFLDAAPIFGDIRKFISEGYAASYTGLVDVVTAGFPCQPFSVAGRRQGGGDERNMWPETIDCIRIIRPQFAFLENVPGLLVSGYFGTIIGDLHESGYDARWTVLSARECGGLHGRPRVWILANSKSVRRKHAINGKGYGNHKWRILAQVSTPGKPLISQEEFRKQVCSADFVRSANGIPNRMDRIRSLGNAQFPRVVATAWRLLSGI